MIASDVIRIGFGWQAALQPGKQFRLVVARAGLQIGHNHDLKFQALRFVDGHQLHAAVDFRRGIGQGLEICRGLRRAQGRARSGSPCGKRVEALPEQIEIGACRRIDALRATQAQPNLFEPGAKCRGGPRGAQTLGELYGVQHASPRLPAVVLR